MIDNDVIAAIATPPGRGGIGVIRLSGDGAIDVLSKVFSNGSRGKQTWVSHTMRHGFIHDNGRHVDEVICAIMRGPRSYTAEDVAEVYCHGGPVVLRSVLNLLLANGARLAEPGEFTMRAFLNGRIDLSQAESVMTLIGAKTDYGRRVGLRGLEGGLSARINRYRDEILTWLAHIGLMVDYPEHEAEAMHKRTIREGCETLLAALETLLATAQTGRVLVEGVKTAIVGRPNVGKSSLMNAVLCEERAIVTEMPGTTRDILSETVNIRGVPVILADTAGIRETSDKIEQIGVNRARAQVTDAALIWFVVDGAEPLQQADFDIIALLETVREQKNVMVIINKSDLTDCVAPLAADARLQALGPVYAVSAKNGAGLDKLYRAVEDLYLSGVVDAEDDILVQARHEALLKQAVGHLNAAVNAIDADVPEDLVALDLNAAYERLSAVVGETVGEDVLDRIFSEFCLGK